MAAKVIGSGAEQGILLPLIERSAALREPHTLSTADAGYHIAAVAS